MRISEALNFCKEIIRNAGEILIEKSRYEFSVRTKRSETDFVSEVDIQIEQFLVDAIQKRFPSHNILSEETQNSPESNGQCTWIIDPIDGTFNYIHQYPIYSISIALCQGKETLLGCVHIPMMDECYWTAKGLGAFCNDRKLEVSKVETLSEALVSTGFAFNKSTDPDNNLREIAALTLKTGDIRQSGSAAFDLACVAAGRIDAFWEFELEIWDTAAGSLLVHEAGGVVSSIRGEEWPHEKRGILAANPMVHKKIQTQLRSAQASYEPKVK